MKNLGERRHADDRHLTNAADQNIIHSDLQRQGAGGRLQIGTLAGFRSEQVAAFELDCMADIVGTRTQRNREIIRRIWECFLGNRE